LVIFVSITEYIDLVILVNINEDLVTFYIRHRAQYLSITKGK